MNHFISLSALGDGSTRKPKNGCDVLTGTLARLEVLGLVGTVVCIVLYRLFDVALIMLPVKVDYISVRVLTTHQRGCVRCKWKQCRGRKLYHLKIAERVLLRQMLTDKSRRNSLSTVKRKNFQDGWCSLAPWYYPLLNRWSLATLHPQNRPWKTNLAPEKYDSEPESQR